MGVALHMAPCALVFCEDEAVVELSFDFPALLMAAGWMTEETRAPVIVLLPIMKVGLTHSCFSSMHISLAGVDAGRCSFNMHRAAVSAHRDQCALKRI